MLQVKYSSGTDKFLQVHCQVFTSAYSAPVWMQQGYQMDPEAYEAFRAIKDAQASATYNKRHLDFVAQFTTEVQHIRVASNQAADVGNNSLQPEKMQLQDSHDTILRDVSLGIARSYILPLLFGQFFKVYHLHQGIHVTEGLIQSKFG